jgi:hypothetical protein
MGWPGNQSCEPTQVLCDSCERELVLGATWATQPEATKPQNLGPLAASAIYSCGHPRFMFVVRLHLVKRDRDGKRGQASPNAGTRYRRPNYLRCSHSFRNATATANALKNAKMVANIG